MPTDKKNRYLLFSVDVLNSRTILEWSNTFQTTVETKRFESTNNGAVSIDLIKKEIYVTTKKEIGYPLIDLRYSNMQRRMRILQ